MTPGEAPTTPPQGIQARPWVCGLLLFVLAVLVYLPATRGGFVWDDVDVVTENPCIVGPLGLADIWTSSQASLCPLVQTTFWIEHRLWGLDPWPYHVVNIMMHAAAAVVLWRVLLRLKVPGAWLGAALWALHPVQVESVAWISEMKNTQSGLFFLLSILFFCKSRQARSADGAKDHSRFYDVLTLVFGGLALASKSSTVVLPLVLALCAWWLDGAWRWRRNLFQLAPLLLMSALAGAVTMWTQKLEGAGTGQEWTLSGLPRVAVAGKAVWFYLGKLVWPHPLTVIYPRWDVVKAGVYNYLPAIAVVAMFVFLWSIRNRWNGRGLGLGLVWAYFVLTLLPVLGLLDYALMRLSFVFDHFQYLASMGPLALAGCGISVGLDRFTQDCWKRLGVCSLFLLTLGVLTRRQCAIYQDEEVLWTATASSNPLCWTAHNNLGMVLGKRGQLEDAMTHFQKALEIRPSYAEAENNLGMVLKQKGQTESAMAHFQKAIELNPSSGEALYNLGLAFQQMGHLDEAVAHYQKALQIRTGFAEGHNNLGLALQGKGQLDEAVAHYEKALEIRADYAEAHNNLGTALARKSLEDQAVKHFRRAVDIKPDFEEARHNLGIALQKMGSVDEALKPSPHLPEMGVDSAEAHNDLGIALGQKGQFDEAMAQFRKALEIKGDFAEAHYNLALAFEKKGQMDEAMAHFEKAIEIKPDYAAALRRLAYMLAASDEARLRDGAKAVQLAQRASELTGGNNPTFLGTLSAAQAEAGRFPEAVETVERAIQLAETQRLASLAAILQQHLKLYQSGKSLRGGQ